MLYSNKKICIRWLSLVLAVILAWSLMPASALAATETEMKTVAVSIDSGLMVGAYECKDTDRWVPMFPSGQPDNSTTWPVWDDSHYATVIYQGYQDIGALYMKSAVQKNTAVAICANLTPGRSYTLGMWVKGSTNNPNKVLALYGNGNGTIVGAAEYSEDNAVSAATISQQWTYVEKNFTADRSQLNLLVPDWGDTEVYIDNITLKRYSWSQDVLGGMGDFYQTAEVAVAYEPVALNPLKTSSAYNCRYSECWVPMFPAGQPDPGTTWPEWDSSHYGEIVETGCKDMGALHMVSAVGKNTGVAINAGMTPGKSYTLGMWVKGTASNPNKVLALYNNGDAVIVGNPQYSPDGITGTTAITEDWMYVERSFVANQAQLNLIVPDWGNTEVFVDNITLKNAEGNDLLAQTGDFRQAVSTAVEDANLDFEANAAGVPHNWAQRSVLADTTVDMYTENVYSGNQALWLHRQNGQLDYSFLYSQSLIPVSFGDCVELVAHIASRNSISGSFSMYVLGLDQNGNEVDSSYGQERITHAGESWSQWDTYELVYTVPEQVKKLQFGIRVGGANADVLIDDLTYYNHTKNQNCIYEENFEKPSVTTGLRLHHVTQTAGLGVGCALGGQDGNSHTVSPLLTITGLLGLPISWVPGRTVTFLSRITYLSFAPSPMTVSFITMQSSISASSQRVTCRNRIQFSASPSRMQPSATMQPSISQSSP